MFKHKKDVFYNHRLKEAVEKRKKLLLNLRKMDYKKFEWVLEKLDLIYQSIPK
jgi:small subunit ribosomal protein S15